MNQIGDPLKQTAAPRRQHHPLFSPVVKYHGLARRYLMRPRFPDAAAA
jgi:hypothetical protein